MNWRAKCFSSALFPFLAVLSVFFVQQAVLPQSYLLASMGAACVLFFQNNRMPSLSLFWGAHTLAACIEIICVTSIPSQPVTAAASLGLVNGLTQIFKKPQAASGSHL